jgi:hypothetical protein
VALLIGQHLIVSEFDKSIHDLLLCPSGVHGVVDNLTERCLSRPLARAVSGSWSIDALHRGKMPRFAVDGNLSLLLQRVRELSRLKPCMAKPLQPSIHGRLMFGAVP